MQSQMNWVEVSCPCATGVLELTTTGEKGCIQFPPNILTYTTSLYSTKNKLMENNVDHHDSFQSKLISDPLF